MMEKCKYTFLLPAFKASFFEEALLSIKNQTYKDFKVIVSDDCSPEDLKSIYDKVCADDPRFSYRRNETNMGSKSLVSHWNLLVDMCDTEFLIMASDDDVYGHNFLAEINSLADKYPNADLFRARARKILGINVVLEDFNIDEYLNFPYYLTCFGGKNMVHCLANYVFRTSRMVINGGFPDFPKAAFSDSAAAMLMSYNGIGITKEILFSFRISDENLSSEKGYNRNLQDIAEADLRFVDWYDENLASLKEVATFKMSNLRECHRAHVEGTLVFILPRMPLGRLFHYMRIFNRKGYFKSFALKLSVLKNWLMIRA